MEADDNVMLYTIASSESDIRMCMIINEIFRINMSLADDLIVKSVSLDVGFKKYMSDEEVEEEKILLFINHHPSGKYLFPELKKVDYLLVIKTEVNKGFSEKIKELKNTPGVTAVIRIEPSSTKSFKHLIL